jgi:hypothetical protein
MHLDQAKYPRSTIQGLLHGYIRKHLPGGDIISVEVPSWAAVRSVIEHRGEVDQPAFHEVMDLERALEHLGARHPQAAAVAILRMWGYTGDDLEVVLPSVGWKKLARKAEAWMHGYLNGRDPEAAYRKTK